MPKIHFSRLHNPFELYGIISFLLSFLFYNNIINFIFITFKYSYFTYTLFFIICLPFLIIFQLFQNFSNFIIFQFPYKKDYFPSSYLVFPDTDLQFSQHFSCHIHDSLYLSWLTFPFYILFSESCSLL